MSAQEFIRRYAMEAPALYGKLIGARLCINGYIYTKNHVDKRGRIHWECTRCRKKLETEKCRARAITLQSSHDEPAVLRGPKESRHNHKPVRAEIDEAVSLAKKRLIPEYKPTAGPSQPTKDTSQTPDPQVKPQPQSVPDSQDKTHPQNLPDTQDKPDPQNLSDAQDKLDPQNLSDAQDKPVQGPISETNKKEYECEFAKDPRMYRAFLRELRENPEFDKENLMENLRYVVKWRDRQAAYETIIENLEKVKSDLRIFQRNSNAVIETIDGKHFSYEPTDPFERMTEREKRLNIEKIRFETYMMIKGVTLEQQIEKSMSRIIALRQKSRQELAKTDSEQAASLKCDKSNRSTIRHMPIECAVSEKNRERIKFSSLGRIRDIFKRPLAKANRKNFSFTTSSSASNSPSTSSGTHNNGDDHICASYLGSKKILDSFPTKRKFDSLQDVPLTSKKPRLISDIRIPPIPVSMLKTGGMCTVGNSSTTKTSLFKHETALSHQTLGPTESLSNG